MAFTLHDLIYSITEDVNIQIEDGNSMDIIATYDCNERIPKAFKDAMGKYSDCEWQKDFTFEIQNNWIYVYIKEV